MAEAKQEYEGGVCDDEYGSFDLDESDVEGAEEIALDPEQRANLIAEIEAEEIEKIQALEL